MNKDYKRLTPEEATFLGYPIKDKGIVGNPKYYISEEEYKRVLQLREKVKEAKNIGIIEAFESAGVDKSCSPDLYLKSKEYSIRIKNPFYSQEGKMEELWNAMLQDIRDNVRVLKKIDYKTSENPGLLVISPADVHIGKLASAFETFEDYNSSIACERVSVGISTLIKKAKNYNVEKVLLLIGNDILHIDTSKRTTTNGTPQDTDGMWYDNFLLAKRLYFDVINELREIAPVHVQFNPSNHDYMSGFYLSQVVEALFTNTPDVTFDVDMTHRKYYTYGVNLIGSTHGNGAKIDNLPMLMANESLNWSTTIRRYFYIHHIHHKIAKDYMSVEVEAMRSTSSADGWHHREGYQHAPKTMQAFYHDKLLGRTDVITHYF